MKEILIRRQREAQRRAVQRRRDLLVLAGSLAFHVLLVFSVPSFSREVDIPPVLLIELKQVSPELKLPGPAATAPNYAPEPQGARAGILSPDLTAGQGQSGAKSAVKPEPAIKQRAKHQPTAAPVKPAVKPVPAPVKPGPSKAAPPPIPESKAPQVEQASPAVPAKNNPVQPEADPPPSPAKPGDGSGGGGKVEGTGKEDGFQYVAV